MAIHIRPATSNDQEEILGIVNYAIAHTTAIYDYEPRSMEAQLEWFADKTVNNHAVLIAEVGGKVAGFASYGTFKAKAGYRFTMEHSVYIAPDFHGKGLGSALLQELIAVARKNGIKNLIGYVDSDNGGSIAFHKKFGFEEVGVLKNVGFKFERWLDVVIVQLEMES